MKARIYDLLVEDPNDFLGILSYSVYKRLKNEQIEAHEAKGTDEALDLTSFYDTCRTDSQQALFRNQALDLAQAFANETIGNEIEIQRAQLEKEYCKTGRAEFWWNVWSSVVGSLAFVLLLGLILFCAWAARYGVKETFENVFDVKISPRIQTVEPPREESSERAQ